jgi:hypothetical protein
MSHKQQDRQASRNKGRYINLFITGKCSPDLLANELFPNAKEITESYAMFEATTHLEEGFEWNREGVTCVVVGDGHKPRTGAMFAYRTAWNVVSVDPKMVPRTFNIKRLTTYRRKIEECTLDYSGPVVIVLPHSHAKIAECLKHITSLTKRAVITMDCCVNNIIPGKAPDVEYEDLDVWSPKNIVRVWRSV